MLRDGSTQTVTGLYEYTVDDYTLPIRVPEELVYPE